MTPSKPWLHLYAPGQPAHIQPQFSHALDLYGAALARAPDLALLRYFDGALRLREVEHIANALAHALHARGFAPGDRLAIYTQNNPAFVIAMVAAWKLGGAAVPVNPMNRQRELRHILQDSGAQALVCLDTLYAVCDRVAVLSQKTVRIADRLDVVARQDDAWIQAYFHGPRGRAARTSHTAPRDPAKECI